MIITTWTSDSGKPAPEGVTTGIIAVQECTDCGESRAVWPDDVTHNTDPWKGHFDYCPFDKDWRNNAANEF